MSLPKNCPNEPGLYWAMSKAASEIARKTPDLLVEISGELPFLNATTYWVFHSEVEGLEGVGCFLGPCDLPGEPECQT